MKVGSVSGDVKYLESWDVCMSWGVMPGTFKYVVGITGTKFVVSM